MKYGRLISQKSNRLIYCILAAFSFCHLLTSQTFEAMANMPEPVSNNAVTSAKANNTTYIYSFSGIDSTLNQSGIHLKSFRYNISANEWERIADLPDPNGGKIAAGASTVKNLVYVIGG